MCERKTNPSSTQVNDYCSCFDACFKHDYCDGFIFCGVNEKDKACAPR